MTYLSSAIVCIAITGLTANKQYCQEKTTTFIYKNIIHFEFEYGILNVLNCVSSFVYTYLLILGSSISVIEFEITRWLGNCQLSSLRSRLTVLLVMFWLFLEFANME